MHFDLAHALVAMFEHAFEPFGVEHAGAGFQRDLFPQRAHRSVALGLVADIDRWRFAAFGHLNRLCDAAQGIEIIVHRGDAQFYRVQVLVGELHIG